MHWPQLFALFGIGGEPARVDLALKREPLPTVYIVGLLAAIALLEHAPYVEEWWRGWTQRRCRPLAQMPANAPGGRP